FFAGSGFFAGVEFNVQPFFLLPRHGAFYARETLETTPDLPRRLQREGMLPSLGDGCIAKGLIDRSSVIPIGKLIHIVAAANLARLASRKEHDRAIPICYVRYEAHRGTMMLGRGSRPVGAARFRLFCFPPKKIFNTPRP